MEPPSAGVRCSVFVVMAGGLIEEALFLALHHDEVQAADADALEGGS